MLTDKLWLPESKPILTDVCCTVPILEDIYGDTALDVALCEERTQKNVANQILLGIENYPFMHSGFALVSGILKAFENECPAIG